MGSSSTSGTRGRRRPPKFERPAPAQAARQLTAFTYGTVLTLAALVVLSLEEIESGVAVVVVAGVAVSTFVAHLFADVVGSSLEAGHDADADGKQGPGVATLLRSSLPIVTAAAAPLAFLAAAALDVIGPTPALRLAEIYCLGRLALTGFFVARYQGRPATGATWIGGGLLAALGVGVVLVKVLLGH